MIIAALCNSCFSRFDIAVAPEDISLLKGMTDQHGLGTCPRHCGGRINLRAPTDEAMQALTQNPLLKEALRLSVQELFKAVKGGGLPDEIPKSYELAVALFKSEKVDTVFMEQDGKDIYLHEIRFANGSTIHLGSGKRGAQVVKITRKA